MLASIDIWNMLTGVVSPKTIMKVLYMTEAGYTIDPFVNKASDAAIDLVNEAISGVRDEFKSINPGNSKKNKNYKYC